MKLFNMPQNLLGFRPPKAGGEAGPTPTVPPAAQLFTRGNVASDSYTAETGDIVMVTAGAGRQAMTGAGSSPVVLGDRMYRPQYTPLADVAFPVYDAAHRTWQNLTHPLPPTADAAPRPDWNPFASLRNWPMRAMAGLQTTIFGGPQAPSLRGRP